MNINTDFLIVGAGFFGSVLAERIANDLKESVTIIDKRNHIGGNAYSYADPDTNIEIHKYGSHLFHTSDEEVWNYLSKFTKFNDYQHKVYTTYKDIVYSMPINLDTINKFYKLNMSPDQAFQFIQKEIEKSDIKNPKNFEEKAVSLIGRPLYEAFIYGYTTKQWETNPKELPEGIINRLPVRYNYNNRYFKDRFEGLPVNGYGSIFEKMLNHSRINIYLGVDFFSIKDSLPKNLKIIYSGPIDRYFNYKFGPLGWRTLDFEKECISTCDFQGTSVMNYSDATIPYTRIHEFKHFHPERKQSSEKTIIYKEYSRTAKKVDDPYYPINTKDDKEIYSLYLKEARKVKNTIFGGRLGTYKYLDMHQVISTALNTYQKLKLNK